MKTHIILIISIIACCVCHAQDEPLGHHESLKEYLEVNPSVFLLVIEVNKVTDSEVEIKVTNKDERKIQYFGSKSSIQEFEEKLEFGKWKENGFDWCGTGKVDVVINPNETITLTLYPKVKPSDGVRISALFRVPESKMYQHIMLYKSK